MRARVSRKWYLVVIVLLYIGLLASFSLNITLLMRKAVPVSQIKSAVQEPGDSRIVDIRIISKVSSGHHSATTPIAEITRRTEKSTQLGFAYTTPCLVTGLHHDGC